MNTMNTKKSRLAISGKVRDAVYQKYDGHCAYCGRVIERGRMQVDHMVPQYHWAYGLLEGNSNDFHNLMPACSYCNHYKGGYEIEEFRRLLKNLHKQIEKLHKNRVAYGFGIINIKPWDGIFFYEKKENEVKYAGNI